MLSSPIQALVFEYAGTLIESRCTEHPELLPGHQALENCLARRGIPVAVLFDDELPATARLLPETWLCLPAQPQRRFPAPDPLLKAATHLAVDQLRRGVLVSGTVAGVQAGLNAGWWTIGTAMSGPLPSVGLNLWRDMEPADQDRVRMQATLGLMNAGAHYVIDTIADLNECLLDIQTRLERNERP
ncbi:hypothetical protein [Pseudomonas jilinensis]|uniref:Phosphonoacetaldehyde phosphonohydrolase-related protein n=1 Tax=Pseudomonas jilinensis TaxID=2078689 RepID=A0A396RU72_9PSED|nr:hypothetical protein [Pseudomonas jilinensis]RHW20120.1 hypothetical protein C2846_14915 [Pseudomonas jilinensis]